MDLRRNGANWSKRNKQIGFKFNLNALVVAVMLTTRGTTGLAGEEERRRKSAGWSPGSESADLRFSRSIQTE